jgi:hypothetical protein
MGGDVVTARDGETIREIVGLLGEGEDGGVDAGDAVKRMVKMNKGRLRAVSFRGCGGRQRGAQGLGLQLI